MPNNIYHKRNANPGVVPTAAQLTVGEIALNTADGKAYTRTTAGTVVELTEASVADGGEQFTPLNVANLAMWLDAADTSTLYQNATGDLAAVTTPLDIPNCAAWYDASDSSTLFAADTGSTLATTTVGRWANKSGSAQVRDLLQSNASARPTLTANVFNGLPAVVFDGVNDFMQRSFTLGFPTTLFIVFAYNSAYSAASTLADGAGAGNLLRLAAFSNTEFLLNAGAVTPQITANLNTLPITQLQIISATADGSNSGVWRNNFLAAGQYVTGTTNTPNGLTLCSWGAFGLQYANASIAEVIVYSANLTTAQRTRVEKYLAAKWGVSAAVLTDATTAATAVSNPIGYWGDKSGNGRYAFQQISGNRPVRGTVNGRSSISLTGSSFQALLTSVSDSLGGSIGPYTVFGVANSTAAELNRVLMGAKVGANYDIALYYNSNNGPAPFVNLYTTSGSRTHTSPVVATNPTAFSFAIQRTSSTAANTTFNTWQNGVRLHTQTSLGTLSSGSLRKLLETLGASRTGSNFYDGAMTGNFCELAVYPQALTDAQIIALSQYANQKWNAALATFPRVSNVEAQDWINRVYTNNGTVSVSTAYAVNAFCNAVDAAGIRDRFYRLNLFCGDNLNACLVPLYRSWAYTTGKNLVQGDAFNSWTTQSATLAANSVAGPAAAPLGAPLAAAFFETTTATNAPHIISSASVSFNGAQVVVSAYVKANGRDWAMLTIEDAGGTPSGTQYFNLTGTAAGSGYSGAANGTITDVGNGWRRVSFTCSPSSGAKFLRIYTSGGNNNNVTIGDATKGLYVWGAQVEYTTATLPTAYETSALGNATDTNNNFTSSDYNERGAVGGLKGNGSSKYLNTGFAVNMLTSGDRHLAAYETVRSGAIFDITIGAEGPTATAQQFSLGTVGQGVDAYGFRYSSGTQYRYETNYTQKGAMYIGSHIGTDGFMYKNGVALSLTDNGTNDGVGGTTNNSALYVFALNRANTLADFTGAIISGYSTGLAFSSAQALAYYNAMQTFQTTLARSV